MKVELLHYPSGDWQVLRVDGKIIYEGHHIPFIEWLRLIAEFPNVEIDNREITDKDRQEGLYYESN